MTDDAEEETVEARDLAELFSELAGDLEGIDVLDDGAGALEYRRAGRPFAAVAGPAAEFRLRPEITEAALRTVDTSRTPRGADWVRFTPRALDRFAFDRAEAWFLSAWRSAGPR